MAPKSLLDVPPELRMRMYREVFRNAQATIRRGKTSKDSINGDFNKNILLICRMIHQEALGVLAQMITLKIETNSTPYIPLRLSLLHLFPLLRCLTIIHRPAAPSSFLNPGLERFPDLRKVKILSDLRFNDYLTFPPTLDAAKIDGYLEGSEDEGLKANAKARLLMQSCIAEALQEKERKLEIRQRFTTRVMGQRDLEEKTLVSIVGSYYLMGNPYYLQTLTYDVATMKTLKRCAHDGRKKVTKVWNLENGTVKRFSSKGKNRAGQFSPWRDRQVPDSYT